MKAIFPKKGVLIITKYNVNILKEFYKNNLINSKLFSIYQQQNYSIQVGNFAYFPKATNIILDNAHLLTLLELKKNIFEQIKNNPESVNLSKKAQEISDENIFSNEPIDDNFIKTNPFFKTLTSL